MTSSPTRAEIAVRILELCERRGSEKTICPSEVARSLAGNGVALDRRDLMEPVRQAAGRLAEEGRVEVCQKGRTVDIEEARGPIRLRLSGKQN